MHEHQDSVGVIVIEGLKAGTDMLVCVTHDDPAESAKGNSVFRLKVGTSAPIGHKIALKDLKKGDTVFKYGEDIGIITADVKKLSLIHI